MEVNVRETLEMPRIPLHEPPDPSLRPVEGL